MFRLCRIAATQQAEQEAHMARNWLRHHVDAQDGQAVIRKIVVSPTAANSVATSDSPNSATMTPQQARDMVERAKKLRQARQRRVVTSRMR
jgi:hypothetical protein